MIDEQKQQETTLGEQNNVSTSSETENTMETSPETSTEEFVQTNEVTESQSESETTEEIIPEVQVVSEGDETATTIESENEQIIAALQEENANLKRLFDEQVEQANTAKAQYARLAADFENFRKRTIKEKESLEQQSKKNVIAELLPVVDNFERARVQIKPSTEGEQTIQNSYQGVYKTLVDCLKRMGVSAMRPEGQEFDPNFHEAMLREPSSKYPEGTVIEQLMRGYMLGDLVLRHAMVKVAVPSEPVITSEEETEGQQDSLDSAESLN